MAAELKKVLLIGNGPAATRFAVGDKIDQFDGEIVRFNAAVVEGYEERLGSRTDIWATCGDCDVFNAAKLGAKTVLFTVPYTFRTWTKKIWDLFTSTYGEDHTFEPMGWDQFNTTKAEVGYHPSSGLLAINYFLRRGYQVSIYGFDNFRAREHHYWKRGRFDGSHCPRREADWIAKRSVDSLLTTFRPEEEPEYLVGQYRDFYDSPASSSYKSYALELYFKGFANIFRRLGVGSFLDWGCGGSELASKLEQSVGATAHWFDPGKPDMGNWDGEPVDLIYSTDVLEHVPMAEVHRLLNDLRPKSKAFLHAISTRPAANKLPDGQNMHCLVRSASWWGGFLSSVYVDKRVRAVPHSRSDTCVFLATD